MISILAIKEKKMEGILWALFGMFCGFATISIAVLIHDRLKTGKWTLEEISSSNDYAHLSSCNTASNTTFNGDANTTTSTQTPTTEDNSAQTSFKEHKVNNSEKMEETIIRLMTIERRKTI